MVEAVSGSSSSSGIDTPVELATQVRFRPTKPMWLYLGGVVVMYASGLLYASTHGLSIRSLLLYGLLQPPGVTGNDARLAEIATPLSWNLPQGVGFV
jgi:hypothetical protein